MNFKNMGGNSGCKIFLVSDSGKTPFVRKISADKNYNLRLQNQEDKQKNFVSTSLYTPEIYSDGFTHEGLFYFDMEYIRGITLAEYVKTIQVSSINGIAEAIINSFSHNISEQGDVNPSAFTVKIKSLESQLSEIKSVTANRAVDILSGHNWKNFHHSPCHGDLTLENIIIKDGKLYLIDFLDSFYDCWLLDAATLFQDVWLMWSYRNGGNDINTVIRLIILRDILSRNIQEKSGPLLSREIYYALLLKLIRIYPYAKDKKTLEFLDAKTEIVMRELKE